MQFLVDGAWTKRFHVGYAAMNGLIAASFAREGFKGAVEAIEGKAGFDLFAGTGAVASAVAVTGDSTVFAIRVRI